MSEVATLTGTVNGAGVIFSRNAAGRWETTVPASGSNTYVIELWAEDDAGNTAYFATVRVTIDTQNLCTRIEILDVGARFGVEEVGRMLGADPIRSKTDFAVAVNWALLSETVQSKIVRCEVCGK